MESFEGDQVNAQDCSVNPVIETIMARSSTKKFAETPVSLEVQGLLLAAAVRAPDHGQLAPWRFTVLEGESREILGRAMAAAMRARTPDADADAEAREATKALRSPLLIIVSASTQPHPKVPEIEQWVAVGAAIQNLWLAAQALGLGVAWKTGSHAYSREVKAALGLDPTEAIIGFVHVGVPVSQASVRPVQLEGKVRRLGQ